MLGYATALGGNNTIAINNSMRRSFQNSPVSKDKTKQTERRENVPLDMAIIV